MNTTKKDLKIVLISLQNEGDRVPPFGLVSLATCLEQKIGIKDIRIIDRNFEDVVKETIEYRPDLIGISAMTIYYGDAIKVAEKLKQNLKAPIIIGGVHISTLPTSLNKNFDIGVVGEGEEIFLDLVKLFQSKNKFDSKDLMEISGLVFWDNGGLKITARRPLIENLDSISMPDYKYINKAYFEEKPIIGQGDFRRRGWIITSRGCPFKCRFCATSAFWGGGKIRFHSPEYIIKSIKSLVKEHNISHLIIEDDLFTIYKDRIKKFIELFEKEGLLGKITLTAQARANTIDDELCEVLKKLNITILQFGFESGSKKILQWLKGPTVSPEINLRAIEICKRNGINVFGSLMMGNPSETIEDMKETINWIKKAIKLGVDYLFVFVATPYPGEEFWEIAKQKNKVSDDMDWEKLSLHAYNKPLLLDESINREEFAKIFASTRKLLRPLKYKMIFEIARKNLGKILIMILKQPLFWLRRFIIFIFKR